jgi:hypothetical protein
MKPTAERYQAATKVNALSPEIDVAEKTDSACELEGSTAHNVMAKVHPEFSDSLSKFDISCLIPSSAHFEM